MTLAPKTTLLLLLCFATVHCGGTSGTGAQTGGSGGSPITAAGGGASTSGGSGPLDSSPSKVSGLPSPKTPAVDVPKASGPSAFTVKSWAAFEGAASYSIDDTQPSLFEHWSELKGTGVRMTFYANPTSNWIAGYDATLSEAASLGFELGNHTMTHCHGDLSGCPGTPPLTPVGTVEEEIDQCTEYLKKLGQSDVWTIAYPFGDLGWKPPSESRFLLGRGVSGGHIGPRDSTDPFNLPAVSATSGNTVEKFDSEIAAVRSEKKWVIFLFHSLLPTTNNWYAGVDVSTITGSAAKALEAGDVWLDSVVNVGAYWVGEKLVAEAKVEQQSGGERRTWTLPSHFPKGKYVRVTVAGGKLTQAGTELPWDPHGYYEVSLDAQEVTWAP